MWEWFSISIWCVGVLWIFNPHHTYDCFYRTAKSMEGMSLHPEDVEHNRTDLQDYEGNGSAQLGPQVKKWMVHAHNLSYEFLTLTGTLLVFACFCFFCLVQKQVNQAFQRFDKRWSMPFVWGAFSGATVAIARMGRSWSGNVKRITGLQCVFLVNYQICSMAFLKMPASTSAYVNVQSQEVNP